jgi:hypothetical protein
MRLKRILNMEAYRHIQGEDVVAEKEKLYNNGINMYGSTSTYKMYSPSVKITRILYR